MTSRLLPIALVFGTLLSVANGAALEEEFRSPPDTARLWVYWTQNGHYCLESATADLEAMKKAGIGGLLRMDCSVGQVPGGSPFLGEKWRKQFVHSVHECERLGLEFTAITGPGWTGTGGPWIRAEQSMQHLVPAKVSTEGPAAFNQVLPLPQPRISRYHRSQTPQMRKEISEFYKDVAVFAFPRREPVIADIQEKALFIRNPYTSMRGVRPYMPSPVSYPAATAAQTIDPKAIIDLTGRLQADGRLVWNVPPGEWTIVRLGARSTGANTRPAPAAGLGLESDKFSKQALATHFHAYFDPLLKAIGPRPPHRKAGFVALDADSWEMSSQNWTAGFREEFQKRRGYDPWRYFATYTGCVVGSREQTERFLWDVRKTCQELLLENHAAELQAMCHRRGLRLMIEPYDMNPAGDLDLGSYADFPAGEFWFDTFQSGWSCINAASIAHTMGKSIVLAEAFTSGRGNWQRTPWALKNQTDWAFATGINKFSIHGFAHQSNDDAPGMTFGPYGVFWNRKQTFWPLVVAYHDYVARCSHLLQQGVTVSDILYLTPEGTPQIFLPSPSALNAAGSRLPDKKGYSFDGCSPNILMARAEVRDGRIAFPGGTSYRMLVLPRSETMTPRLLEEIGQLVEAGAVVLGSPPVASPSLSDYPQCDAEVQQLAARLWGKTGSPVRQVGEGRIILDQAVRFRKDADYKPLLPGVGSWIWFDEGNPASSAAVGDVHFRYTWEVPDLKSLKTARIEATADNSFTLMVNSKRVLAGDNFHNIYSADIASALRQGKNTITVAANNASDTPNPAGFIAAMRLVFADGSMRVITTDGQWDASRNGTAWSTAKPLGPGRMSPWRLAARTSAAPVQALFPNYATTAAVLERMGAPEDFACDGPVRFTHRETDDRDIYFVANTSNAKVETICRFRVRRGSPQLWDPVTTEIRPLPQFTHDQHTTSVPMTFEPHQSFFVIFQRDGELNHVTDAEGVNFPKSAHVTTLTGAWEVSFDPKWSGPKKVTFDDLQDWTTRKEEGIKYYSGMAEYRKLFDLSDASPSGGKRLYLDLGQIENIAKVRVNGRCLGVVWTAPWRVDITDAVKPTGNELVITVANLWVNRLIRDSDLPMENRLTRTTCNPYKPNSPLLPSGLLGPVSVTAEDRAE